MKRKIFYIFIALIVTLVTTACDGGSAKSYHKSGQKSFREEKYVEARAYYDLALEKKSNRADYYIESSLVYLALGEHEQALGQLDQAYQEVDIGLVKENNKKIIMVRGMVYLSSEDYGKAIDQFDLALGLEELPQLRRDLIYYKALSQNKSNEFEKSLKTMENLEVEDIVQIYTLRGDNYAGMGNYGKAMENYRKALDLDPESLEIHLMNYFMLEAIGMKEDANVLLGKAAKIEVKTNQDINIKGLVYFYQGNYDLAQSYFEEVASPEANYYLGKIALDKKEYKQAINYLEKTDIGKEDLAYAYMKIGSYKEALDLSKDGSTRKEKYNEIIALEYLGEFENALKKIKEYDKSYPGQEKEIEREIGFLQTR